MKLGIYFINTIMSYQAPRFFVLKIPALPLQKLEVDSGFLIWVFASPKVKPFLMVRSLPEIEKHRTIP